MQLIKENPIRKMRVNNSYKAFRTACLFGSCFLVVLTSACGSGYSEGAKKKDSTAVKAQVKDSSIIGAAAPLQPLDTALYNRKNRQLANGDSSGRWPIKGSYPNAGAILPFKRIVAYYGNLYSKNMGVLGEYPPTEMLKDSISR